MEISLINPKKLVHIEGFSSKRVEWLKQKIITEGYWIKPIALDDQHHLVLDGQHRTEVALSLNLRVVPVVKYSYADVEVWSLRPKYSFTWQDVVNHALKETPYPYKTVKHRFPIELPLCNFSLQELM